MTEVSLASHYPVVIVGGGQAGLSVSYHLKQAKIDHVILEKQRVAESWRSKRWDNFCLVTPNWQCQLPGFPYAGGDPKGFMKKDEIVEYVQAYADSFDAPVKQGVSVSEVRRNALVGCFELDTSAGTLSADQVVMAIGGYHTPAIPALSKNIPESVLQLHSSEYKNSESLPEGAVLVVGSGQSGCQIAEDLHLAGRKVHLILGDAPRSPRFYRGKDVVEWLDEFKYYDIPIDRHPDVDMVRNKTNHYLTGRDGGREIDLRQFALEGMKLYGFLTEAKDGVLHFAPDLTARLDAADQVYNGIRKLIDDYIEKQGLNAPPEPAYDPPWSPSEEPQSLDLAKAQIGAMIWCTGFRSDFSMLKLPVFNERGYPIYERGITREPGLYFIGLPWLYTWGSGRFSGVARDAKHLFGHILRHHEQKHAAPNLNAASA